MQQAGIYARLSVEHGNEKDHSIENQILLAREWIRRQSVQGGEVQEYRCYIDRGYSGTGFARPGFLAMLQDAREGKIQCIVCKDYSRLGRDYLRTGEYIERIFPEWGIRLVCISDCYDSSRGLPGSLEGSMRNLMNEWYAKDIGRKVRLVKQQQKREGNYLGSRPPYGYQIVHRDGLRLLVREPEAFEIVEWICGAAQRGEGLEQICCRLQERGVNPPGEYHRTRELCRDAGTVKKWDRSTLRSIIARSSREITAHQRGLPHG